MSEQPMTDCPDCGQPKLKRKIGLGAGIIFKGGGFYETDFKDKKGQKESEPSSSSKESADSKGGNTSGESPSKGESKAESKKESPSAAKADSSSK